MKKITFLIALFLVSNLCNAGGGWATCAISITKDDGSAYQYILNNEGWTDGDWGANTSFGNIDFGTPTSLTLNGAAGNGWTDDFPGYNSTSFVLYYRVYKVTETPGEWSHLFLDNQAYHSGNNYIFDKTGANIDLLNYTLSTPSAPQNIKNINKIAPSNLYYLEVVMSKNQFYEGGSWNSMIPDGQGTAYDVALAGYKATFTKSISTGINIVDSGLKIISNDRKIQANFNGYANVELYTINGQLIYKKQVNNTFNQSVKEGIYLLRINGKSHKVVVK